ncbi:MAG TPA: sugar MFS transporter [Puia sp.]|nr:sugar MFS transporter [Puia sp.]
MPATASYRKNLIIIGAFFFIFGFISWINGTLIPYLRIACELEEWQAYLVTFAFYISYTIMAIPSSGLLQRTGMIKGMSLGLIVMAAGCLLFIPAAMVRNYGVFLAGLFLMGGGLTLLQTAVNPYITLLGPPASAAKRISIMGVCNKVAGILAPLIMGSIILKNAGGLIEQLHRMTPAEKTARLDELAKDVILPYIFLAAILLLIAILIRYAHLPEIGAGNEDTTTKDHRPNASAPPRTVYLMGFFAIFFAVGVEVLAGDTIGNYGLYLGINLDIAKSLTSWTLACMMLGYLAGVWAIPRRISQQRAFFLSSIWGLVVTLLIIILPGRLSIAAVALLGIGNAMLWPAIWPQALKGLKDKALARGSAVLIMGIAGGALLPLFYGWLAGAVNHRYAYLIMMPAFLYMLYYSLLGLREKES